MSSLKKVIPGQSFTSKNESKSPSFSIFLRDPFTKGTLNLQDSGISIRNIDGSKNNLSQPSLGATKEPFIRLSEVEFEDGIQSPAGIALDAERKPIPGIDGNPVKRQPIPIFTEAEKNKLTEGGLEVVKNTDKLSNKPDSPFVLLNPSDRPSPRVISNTLSNLKLGESLPNTGGLNALNWSFGQFVNHDGNLGAEGAKDEENSNRIGSFNLPIDIPANDPNFPPNIEPTPTISRQEDEGLQFNFPRGAFAIKTGVPLDNGKPVPGQVRNKSTHWLDLSVVYGSTNELAKELRSFNSGKLKVFSEATPTLKDDLLPTDDKKLMRGGAFQGVGFLAGDERVSENDALAVQHTLWMRNHNRLAEGLSKLHPEWTDEQTFQRARQINIAQYQNVAMYEWLPLQIGDKVDKYQGYDLTTSKHRI
jgi:peroxidase